MRNINKKIIMLILIVFAILGLFFIYKSLSNEEIILDEVDVETELGSNNLAILLEKENLDGSTSYVESESNTWPKNMTFNAELSGCVDIDGNEIKNALEYNDITKTARVKVLKTAYCYLYFDIDKIPPKNFTFYLGGQDNPEYALKSNVSAYLSWEDNDVGYYCLNNENNYQNCIWHDVTGNSITTNYVLDGIDGEKTVYAFLKDVNGNISESVKDTIILNTEPPTNNSVIINNNAAYTTSNKVTLTLSSTGATEMCISETENCTNWESYAEEKAYTFSNTLGLKIIYVKYRNEALNETEALSKSISLYGVINSVPSQSGSLSYSGSSQTATWNNYDSSKLTIGGLTNGINAGTYSATFTPKANYVWSDGTANAKTVNWTIGKTSGTLSLSGASGTITYPNAGSFTMSTNNTSGSVSVSSSNSNVATVSRSGNTITINPGTTAGSSTITVTVAASTNYTAVSKTYTVTVKNGALNVTASNYTGTYDGNAHGITVTNANGGTVTYSTSLTGTYSTTNPTFTNAGTYTVYYIVSKAGYTTVTGSKTVTINKASGSVSLSKDDLSVYTGYSKSITVSRSGNGSISASSSNTSVATVSVSGTTVTVTGKGAGSATITVKVVAGTNHNATSKTVSVAVTNPILLATYIKSTKPLGYNTIMEGGLYRFQGTNVNNYICFGTTDKSQCLNYPDQFMYRIIGINSSNQVKIIKKTRLNAYQWNSTGENDVNWSQSTLYDQINGNYFLYSGSYMGTSWRNKIAITSWKYGYNTNDKLTAANMYALENYWTNSVDAKVGILYLHDYYYGMSGGNQCSYYNGTYANCKTSWIHLSNNEIELPTYNEWTMSHYGYYDTKFDDTNYYSWVIHDDGYVGFSGINNYFYVRPVFYLDATTICTGGSGTSEEPFMIFDDE